MKKIFFCLLSGIIATASSAQILNPVRFDYAAVKKGNNLYELHIKSMIEPKWHLYSVSNPEGGAQATVVKIKDVNTIGALKLNPGSRKIVGTIEYMVCNDRQCLPPKEVEFKIKL